MIARSFVCTRLAPAVLVAGFLLAATPASAQFFGTCTRDELKAAADGYIATQSTGDAAQMPLGGWMTYTEQGQLGTMSTGIISKPLKIDFHRTLIDATNCAAYVEVIVTDPAHPYVIGAKLQSRGGGIGDIEVIVTDAGDWLFNATNTLKYSKAENWDEIPAAERDSRETLLAAANAYLDLFNDKNVQVPWGTPCARLEGGLYTGKGAPGVATPQDSCNVGVPSGVKLVNRKYVVDESLGAVAVFLTFGQNELPDIHTFRIEKGKIRYVHTITMCKSPNCGFPLPDQLKTAGN